MRKAIHFLVLVLPALLVFVFLEWLASNYLEWRFEEFDLAVQGEGEMPLSRYQLWEHPSNYWNWIKINRYNNLGFRRLEDVSVTKPDGVVRIFIMGGSGALGSGANPMYPWVNMSGQGQYSPHETIAGQLEKLINDRYRYTGRRYEVINAATNWSQLHQQIIHYLRKIQFLGPDLVISIDGQNDALPINDPYLSTWDQSAKEKVAYLNSNIRVKIQPLIKRSSFLYLVAALAFAEKRFGDLPVDQRLVDKYASKEMPTRLHEAIEKYAADQSDLIDRGVNFYIDHLWHFSDILRRDNVAALFVQQPQLIMDRSKPLSQRETAMRNYMYTGDFEYEVNFFAFLEERAADLALREGLEYISFLDIFQDEGIEIYTDYTHLTPQGNAIVARRLLTEIETRYPHLLTLSNPPKQAHP